MGNGLANIIAAAIVAIAIVWTGGFGKNRAGGPAATPVSEEEIAKLYARAVGDIRNDIVISCGCCGDGDGPRRAGGDSF
ncbi:MAG: hypothetical protein AAGJ73_03245 [Pseudomonadota bacterium]